MSLTLKGKTITLRDWELGDLESLAYWMKPHHRWHDFNGPYFPRTQEEAIPGLITKHEERIKAGQWPDVRTRLVIAERATNAMLGTVNSYWECEATDWLSVGVAIHDEKNWSKGLGHQALTLWCDYLFKSIPRLVRLGFSTWSGNIGMMRLADKLGFREEARHRKARIVEGEYYDGMGYGVLRTEWERKR